MNISEMSQPVRLVVGISGASGAILGIRLLEALTTTSIETHLVISPSAQTTITSETSWSLTNVRELASSIYNYDDMGACIASGSFSTMGMVVIPCSIKTLSSIANSYNQDLLTRAADVNLKEGRPVVLVTREAPLHHGHIRLMDQASSAGAVIFPPVPAFYAQPKNLGEIVDNIVGRVLSRIGIQNDLYQKWEGHIAS
jgi:4-hydroxy-3-polyprenylbenzoate decarboxylase